MFLENSALLFCVCVCVGFPRCCFIFSVVLFAFICIGTVLFFSRGLSALLVLSVQTTLFFSYVDVSDVPFEGRIVYV